MSIEFVEKKRWLFLGLPFTFTKYVIKEDMITVDTGVFTKVENDCYLGENGRTWYHCLLYR